jgi:5-methylcytosine-specific restriction enzyme subunit McrC
MRKRNFIQVFEYQKIRYEENTDFEEHHFDAMVQFNERNNNKYFNVIHRGIQFNNYVGVIQIGGLTIEILPKVDRDNSNSEHQKIIWQSVLIKMLRVCKHINVDNISESNLRKRNNSILEVYFEMYLDEVDELIRKGLIRKYRRVQSNQLALKGNLVFAQNIQKNIVHKERFFCEHQVYDKEHLLNLIIYKGLLILKRLLNNNLRDKLNRVLFEFKDFKEIEIKSNHFEKIKFRRKKLTLFKSL